jgi:dipeptidyl aminopeptidase/acylaminoacyl peptidase
MSEPVIAPYGAWRSLISAELLTQSGVRVSQVLLDGDDVYWIEQRPAEAGRNVIVRAAADGQIIDCTPPEYNVRSLVHEYGGGAYTVAEGTIYFCNFADQRIYAQPLGGTPQPLTPPEALRYADLQVDPLRQRLIAVREDHREPGEAVNTLVAIDLNQGSPGEVLVGGDDFYAQPRLSPDGRRLAWVAWRHPNMPWDGTELWVAHTNEQGELVNLRLVAGGQNESIFQPEWSPSGVLHFVSDRSGWWNMYRWQNGQLDDLFPMEAEFGLPHWVFGVRSYQLIDDTTLLCAVVEDGVQRLARLDTTTGRLSWIELPYVSYEYLAVKAGRAVFTAASPTSSRVLVELQLADSQLRVIRPPSGPQLDPALFSVAQTIEFPTSNGLTAHAFFYPPHNPHYAAPAGELPPLIVSSHGGPTSATSSALSLGIQYWTSRGFAVVDVNYGGSTGFGRAYRERLNGTWGVVDVEDCVNAANYLVEQGLVDGQRLAIHGGSAGGYTVLCALTFHKLFQAGASYFGISDAEALAQETHKFESRYTDTLIAPYPAERERYVERSPIHFTDQLNCALILFQGLEDKVVPPNQAEKMFDAVRTKGLPVAYIAYEGEQHGFRKAANIIRTSEAELYFYGRVFGFSPADEIEPVEIINV